MRISDWSSDVCSSDLNGMIYGARLLESTRSLRIADPEFATNFDEHVRQCVFYDLLLGRYSMKELSESDDIWATIAPGSAARAQKFLTRQADDSVTASIITCREAYTALSGQRSEEHTSELQSLMRNSYA